SLVVRDGRITEISDGFVNDFANQSATIVDLTDAYVLPGLIDCHTHITHDPYTFSRGRLAAETSFSEADWALLGVVQAKATLAAGFTTVRDVGGFRGGDGGAVFALRDAINRGLIDGPRILTAGQAISVVGGHADVHGFRLEVAEALSSPGVCTGADGCAYAARALIKRGADLIKVTATGGVTDIADSGLGQHFTGAELAAIVEASHLLGRRVAAHAHSAEGIKAALAAGVDSVEHGTFADPDSFDQFKAQGAFFVTTLTAPTYLVEQARLNASLMPEVIREKLDLAMASLEHSTLAATRAGVKMAMGTDSGVSPHGENARELELLVGIGLTEREAIRAATTTAAELIQLDDQIGSIDAGMNADIIAVCENPLQTISALRSVSFVMKDGDVFRHQRCNGEIAQVNDK
ncbi:MAG: amidohydrolase family protein, partial [Pseudomonadota bacterium]